MGDAGNIGSAELRLWVHIVLLVGVGFSLFT